MPEEITRTVTETTQVPDPPAMPDPPALSAEEKAVADAAAEKLRAEAEATKTLADAQAKAINAPAAPSQDFSPILTRLDELVAWQKKHDEMQAAADKALAAAEAPVAPPSDPDKAVPPNGAPASPPQSGPQAVGLVADSGKRSKLRSFLYGRGHSRA